MCRGLLLLLSFFFSDKDNYNEIFNGKRSQCPFQNKLKSTQPAAHAMAVRHSYELHFVRQCNWMASNTTSSRHPVLVHYVTTLKFTLEMSQPARNSIMKRAQNKNKLIKVFCTENGHQVKTGFDVGVRPRDQWRRRGTFARLHWDHT